MINYAFAASRILKHGAKLRHFKKLRRMVRLSKVPLVGTAMVRGASLLYTGEKVVNLAVAHPLMTSAVVGAAYANKQIWDKTQTLRLRAKEEFLSKLGL